MSASEKYFMCMESPVFNLGSRQSVLEQDCAVGPGAASSVCVNELKYRYPDPFLFFIYFILRSASTMVLYDVYTIH